MTDSEIKPDSKEAHMAEAKIIWEFKQKIRNGEPYVDYYGRPYEPLVSFGDYEKESYYAINGKVVDADELSQILGFPDEKSFRQAELESEYRDRIDNSLDSSGGIDHYAGSLGYQNEEDFLKNLEGKKVLDLGSGKGVLSREVHLRGIKAKIVSLEPKLKFPGIKTEYDTETSEYLENYDKSHKTFWQNLKRNLSFGNKHLPTELANRHHNENAIAAIAQELPFKDNSFDLIFDITAISRWMGQHESHSGQEHSPFYKKYLQEAMRVLKPKGVLMITDNGFGWVEKKYKSEPSWKEQVIKNLGLSYEIIWDDPDNNIGPQGVKITKE